MISESGTVGRISIELEHGGEPVVPAIAADVTVTVRRSDGVYLPAGDVTFTLSEGNSTVDVTIAATSNVSPTYARWSVLVTVAGHTKLFREFYEIAPFTPISVTHADICSFIGVDPWEFPSSDTRPHYIYWTLVRQYPALLTANPVLIDDLVVVESVLDSLPAVAHRLWKRYTDGSITAQREKIDIELIEDKAKVKRAVALFDLLGGDDQSTIFGGFIVGQRTDVVTG
jgi:hypothetical protein